MIYIIIKVFFNTNYVDKKELKNITLLLLLISL